MDIRRLTEDYAVTPQIQPDDVADIAAAGFTTIICNRPDMEIPEDLHAENVRKAAKAAGIRFVANPMASGQLSFEGIDTQRAAIAESDGPTLAYCNSGTRSTVVWLFASAGDTPVAELLQSAEKAGYSLGGMESQLEAFAQSRR